MNLWQFKLKVKIHQAVLKTENVDCQTDDLTDDRRDNNRTGDWISEWTDDVTGDRTYYRINTTTHVHAFLLHFVHRTHKLTLTFGTGLLHLIQINHQPDETIFQFIILTFVYSSTCFGRFPAHHQEFNDCNGSLWFYLRIVVIVVLCSWSGRPADWPVGPTTKLELV